MKSLRHLMPTIIKRYIKSQGYKDTADELIYIHIGKCGGASLRRAIADSPIVKGRFKKVHKVHIRKPPVLQNARYLIVIRNPIERAISAFNWRYKLVVEDQVQRNRFEGEWEVLKKYGTLNNLAEVLYIDGVLDSKVSNEFKIIHHLKEDISFYLNETLDHIRTEQIFCVLSTETLNEDIYKNLEVREVARVHENAKNTDESKKLLSDTACENLRKYLFDDYKCIEKLLKLKNTTSCKPSILLG